MKLVRILVGLLIAAILIGALLFSQFRDRPLKVSGFIESYEIRMGSRVGGRVAEVLVDEGDFVQAGAPLIKLEPFDLLQRQAEAEALVRQRRADWEKLQSGFRAEEIAAAKAQTDQMQAEYQRLESGPRQQEIEAAEARLALSVAELDQAQAQYDRISSLVKDAASTQEKLDEAEKALKVARAQRQVAQENLDELKEGFREEDIAKAKAALAEAMANYELKVNGSRQEDIAAAKAALDAATADLESLQQQIKELTVYAPVDGTIEAVDLRPGDLVSANAPALSLNDPHSLWVRAYVPENHLNLQIGQELKVTVDSFPDRAFTGRISFIARQAEFTPGNVQTPEERSKQVFRIKVMLIEGLKVLRPGMSADVWLDQDKAEP